MKDSGTLFGEHLNERRCRDRRMKDQAIIDVADAVTKSTHKHYLSDSREDDLRHELERICSYFNVKASENVPETQDVNEIINYVTRASLIMHRRVTLDDLWWKNGDGPLLVVRKSDGRLFALLQDRLNRYFYVEGNSSKVLINSDNSNSFEREAVCFYRPLPYKEMTGRELIRFLLRSISHTDYAMLLLSTIVLLLIGTLVPLFMDFIFKRIIPTRSVTLVGTVFMLLVVSAISAYFVTVVRTGIIDRIREKMEVLLENAVMGRLMNLPPKFFQGKSSGGLAQSLIVVRQIPMIIMDAIIGPGSIVIFSIIYVIQIAMMSSGLAIPAFGTLVLQWIVALICIRQKNEFLEKELEGDMDAQGLVYPLITGIQRIRLSGCEDRAVALWARTYKKKAGAAYQLAFPSVIQNELVNLVSLLGILVVYYMGRKRDIEVAQLAAFLAAFTLLTTNMKMFLQSSPLMAYLRPILHMLEPLLRELPEVNEERKYLNRLTGKIDINHVSFRYHEDQPYILDDFDLHIKPGEYVAIVGRSGCGKSTVLRLLMGFENVEEGTITYNNVDIKDIDLGFLHRNMGTVLQNGSLFTGDIFSNITISAPYLTMKDAWEAAEKAGVAETIKQMPMGMHSLISEGSGGISGGQKQRLLIARAIVAKPKILIFDEATSALDNITQKIVSDSLDQMNCTRIVVAHRLSTIRNCDRIIVLDGGKIIEDGSYDGLIAKKGFFADLVSRQQVDQ